MSWHRGGWAPYVPVAVRRRRAEKEAQSLTKKGGNLSPIRITGRAIATTFWGKAWCDNLESYSDFSNRLPRGRTYARNGSIVDLQIGDGEITSLVSGSSLYKISIKIQKLSDQDWKALCKACSAEISSLLDLMRGRLSDGVIDRLTDLDHGMFPQPKEIKFSCSCPDYAYMCKHVAATLYGVGHRLDTSPELFFKLRCVDQSELVAQALSTQKADDVIGLNQSSNLGADDLGDMFGIVLATPATDDAAVKTPRPRKRSSSSRASAKSVPAAAGKSRVSKRASTSASATKSTRSATKLKAAKERTLNAGSTAQGKKNPSLETKKADATAKRPTRRPRAKTVASRKSSVVTKRASR